MPFYEYQCTHCGHTLEAMQKVSDPALKKCPHCGKPQLQKLMSAPVFRLKGGGWYETDFKSDRTASATSPTGPRTPKDDKKEAPRRTQGGAGCRRQEGRKARRQAGGEGGTAERARTAPRAQQGRAAPHKASKKGRQAATRPASPAARNQRAAVGLPVRACRRGARP